MPRYQVYKDSGVEWIGEIPEHWVVKKLKYISSIQGSNVDKHVYDYEIQVRLCNYTNVYKNDFINGSVEFNKGSCTEDEYKKFVILEHDVIITKDSETPNDIGVPALVTEKLLNVVCGYHLSLIRTNIRTLLGAYLFRKLQTKYVRNYFEVESNGITRFGLGKSAIESLNVFIPPLPEQTQIVEYLDGKTSLIDKLISVKQRKIELLKEKRTALINHVVTKGLDPNVKLKDSGVEWIGEIPEHWAMTKFKYVSEIITGNTPSKAENNNNFSEDDEGFIWVKPPNLKGDKYIVESEEKLTEEGKSQTRIIPFESILICCIGTIGKYGMSGIELSTNQQINSVVPNADILNNWYCLYYIDVFTRDLINRTNFVTLPIHTKTDLQNSEFILPSFDEQVRIAILLKKSTKEIDDLVSLEQKKIDLLKEYRQSLISEVVTGKIKVTKD